VARGWVRGLPPALAAQPARIAAATPMERAALGYLHANCGHCHNTSAAKVPLNLTLAQRAADPAAARAEVLRATLDATSRYQPAGGDGHAVIVSPGRRSQLLATRMQSRHAQLQMPPLGTQRPTPKAWRWCSAGSATRFIPPKGNTTMKLPCTSIRRHGAACARRGLRHDAGRGPRARPSPPK
jgi:hypothetical protein